jgi:hypothetical protein
MKYVNPLENKKILMFDKMVCNVMHVLIPNVKGITINPKVLELLIWLNP